MKRTNMNTLPEYHEVNGITYQLVGDVYIPLIVSSDRSEKPLGYWGRQRRAYLKHKLCGLYAELLLTGMVFKHLSEIDAAAELRYEELIDALKEENGITETLKARAPLEWTMLMNNIAQSAREIVEQELIYT